MRRLAAVAVAAAVGSAGLAGCTATRQGADGAPAFRSWFDVAQLPGVRIDSVVEKTPLPGSGTVHVSLATTGHVTVDTWERTAAQVCSFANSQAATFSYDLTAGNITLPLTCTSRVSVRATARLWERASRDAGLVRLTTTPQPRLVVRGAADQVTDTLRDLGPDAMAVARAVDGPAGRLVVDAPGRTTVGLQCQPGGPAWNAMLLTVAHPDIVGALDSARPGDVGVECDADGVSVAGPFPHPQAASLSTQVDRDGRGVVGELTVTPIPGSVSH